jgi:dihydrolipoamide dehydrogenase
VDEDKLGGTCLHRGCIPTKALLESAAFAERLRHAAEFGLKLPGEAEVDYAQIAKRRDQVVTRMWKGVQTLVKKYEVTWVAGAGASTVRAGSVSSRRARTGRRAPVASGSSTRGT